MPSHEPGLDSVLLSAVPAVRSNANVCNRSGICIIAIPALMSKAFLKIGARL